VEVDAFLDDGRGGLQERPERAGEGPEDMDMGMGVLSRSSVVALL
jgi:hypothetical protein